MPSPSRKLALVLPGGLDPPTHQGPRRAVPALHALVAELATRHEVHVFCTDFEPAPARWPFAGALVHNLGCPPPRALPGLRALHRAQRLLEALRAFSSPRPFDLLHAFWLESTGLASLAASSALGLPLVLTAAGGEAVSLPSVPYGGARTLRGRALLRLLLSRASAVTVGSRFASSLLPSRSVEVLPLGPSAAHLAPPCALPEGPPWALSQVAHLNAVKDPWTLLGALRLLRAWGLDVRLEHAGGDTLGGAVQRQAQALGLGDAARFHGELEDEEVASLLRRSHLHAVSSRFESQCVAVLEAGLAGVPTVGTRVGLLAELAPRAARAVPVGDARSLAHALAELLRDPEERARLGARARAFALEHTAARAAERFEAVYARAQKAGG